MQDHDWTWTKKSEEDEEKDKKNKKNQYDTKIQEGKEDKEETTVMEITEEEPAEKLKADVTTLAELEGEPFDPFKDLAVLALVDIAAEVKKLMNVPQFFHIKRPVTVIGTGKTAHIKADDLKTVKTEHGAIVFKGGQFHIYPQEGTVKMDGKKVFKEGAILKNGSQIEMGSARFIFLTAFVWDLGSGGIS